MNIVRRLRTASLAAAVLLAGSVNAQVLKQVPSDALVVVKINSLSGVNQKFGAFTKQLGVDQMLPMLSDPLGALDEKTQFKQGVKKDGDAAFVFFDPTAMAVHAEADVPANGGRARARRRPGGDPSKSALILYPVSDYDAFLKNFQGGKESGNGIMQVDMPNSGGPGFIAHWGDYAAISPSQDVLGKKPDGITTEGATAKELDGKDIVVFANFKQIRARALPQLKQARTMIVNQAGAAMRQQGKDQKYLPVLKAAVNRLMDVAEGFLEGTDAMTFGIQFADQGIKTTLMADFVQGSYAANIVSKLSSGNQPLLAGLPQEKYLFFGGNQVNSAPVNQAIDDFLAPIKLQTASLGEEAEPVTDYIDAFKRLIAAQQGSAFGVVAPTAQLGQESLVQSVTVVRGDSAALKVATKEAIDNQSAFMSLTQGSNTKMTTKYTANAKTVAGVTFDQFQTQFSMDAKTPQEMQVAQFLTFIYGPEGISVYTAPVDAQHLLSVAGGNEELMTAAVNAVKANQDTLSQLAQIQAVNANLPQQNRIGVFYFPIDNLVNTGVTYAQRFGMPVKLQIPPNLPPVGFTASTDGNALRFDSYIPSQLVQSLVAAGMQAFMAMQGGGQPGGPGGL